jgi:hypothetical protein
VNLLRFPIDLLRALADGIELGLSIVAPIRFPSEVLEEDEITGWFGGEDGFDSFPVDERLAAAPGDGPEAVSFPGPASGHLLTAREAYEVASDLLRYSKGLPASTARSEAAFAMSSKLFQACDALTQ